MPHSAKACLGFSLIELLISLAILGLLATLAAPLMELTIQRKKEQELRTALKEIRVAIDAYKQAVDDGKISIKADESGYPPNLHILVEGVMLKNTQQQDLNNPESDKKKTRTFFLRRLPRDPFYPDLAALPEDTWGKRSYASDYKNPREGKDVYDIYSLSPETALNGTPYGDW